MDDTTEGAQAVAIADCHFALGALVGNMINLQCPPFGPADCIASIQSVLREEIKKRNIAPGEWVKGFGYYHTQLKEAHHLTKDDLDAVSTEHPIIILHGSLHHFSANSLALKIMEIDENLENPIGGYIHRVPGTNIPDGVCDGTVRYRIFNYMPLPIPEEALELGASFTLHNDFPCLRM